MPIIINKIVSGGQTGVDRAALDVAIELNIEHGGWCPFGRKAEDGLISSKYKLTEAPALTIEESSDPDAIYKIRTELNARDSDGTLVIVKDAPIGGTLYTIEMAQKHQRPCLVIHVSDNNQSINEVLNWIIENKICKLNVAGPRALQTVGIYDLAYAFLHQLLRHELLNKDQLSIQRNAV